MSVDGVAGASPSTSASATSSNTGTHVHSKQIVMFLTVWPRRELSIPASRVVYSNVTAMGVPAAPGSAPWLLLRVMTRECGSNQ